MEQKPAERYEPASPRSGMLTRSGEKCRDLETEISSLEGNLEVLNVGKRPSMLYVPALLLTTLKELTEEQLKTFQSHLTRGWTLVFPLIPDSQLKNTNRQDTVDQMVKGYGPERAVRNTVMFLRRMKLDDLPEKLQRDHSAGTATSSYKLFDQPRHRPIFSPMEPEYHHHSFSSSLFQPGSSKKLLSLSSASSSGQLISQEVAASGKERKPAGEESEEPSSELPSPSSGMLTLSGEKCRSLETVISSLKGNLEVLNVGKRPSMLDVPALLLTSLEELTEEQLKTFQSHLTRGQLFGFPLIPERQLENTSRQETVDQMVKSYGPERAVEITLWILREMNLDDLAETLQRDYTRVLLLTSLEELTEEQLKTFQSKLNVGRMLGSPPIPEKQLENTSRQETVDQMVKRFCPEGAMRITLWILREMNLDDLAEKLERDYTREPNDPTVGQALPISSSPVSRSPSCSSSDTGPSEGREERVLPAQGVVADTELEELTCKETTPTGQSADGPGPSCSYNVLSHTSSRQPSLELCNEFTPDVLNHEGNGTYRFQCPSAGLFQCSITGLVFRMEGEVFYKTVHWDRRLLSQSGKRPAGPLFKFTCLNGSVCQLHLPHCQIHSDGGCDFLSVAHVTDDNTEFIPPLEITETHIIINITGFSAYGNVHEEDAPISPIQGLVLLFHQPFVPEQRSILNVFLLPSNVVRKEVREVIERDGIREILTTSPCKLTPTQEYTLSTNPADGHRIQPKEAEFVKFDSYENYYYPTFQLFLQTIVKEVDLLLKEKEGDELVWNRLVWLPASPTDVTSTVSAVSPAAPPANPSAPPGRAFIIRHRMNLETRLGLVQPLFLRLQDRGVLIDEEREEVDSKSTPTRQNQALLDMVVRKGARAQEHFYQVLKEVNPCLVEDLEEQTD